MTDYGPDTEYNLAASLATLIDAITTSAPRDFLEAAVRDGMDALQHATGKTWEELPTEYFTWGRTKCPVNHQGGDRT